LISRLLELGLWVWQWQQTEIHGSPDRRTNPYQRILFYSASTLDSKVILKILKRYYSKFKIFILILNNKEYEKLLKINKIDLLNNVQVLNPNKFINLNFKVFKDLN